jgi:hypothetical protein
MSEIAETVTRFIADHISSVVQLEALLLLRSDRRGWTADDLSRELRIDHDGALTQLERLASAALLVRDEGTPITYRYAPASEALTRVVEELAAAYDERRVTIIGLIYSKPSDSLQVFANAFRFRGGDKNG